MNSNTDILKQFANIEEVLRDYNRFVNENKGKRINENR